MSIEFSLMTKPDVRLRTCVREARRTLPYTGNSTSIGTETATPDNYNIPNQ